ncbi:hypothetical protein FRB97_000092 [Tulasnella sp. 331]|nr:hypothetical protein FRB97_000092 [Tulasnella sp. 331]
MSTPLARRSIALLTGSTRTPRVGPSVSAFIETVLAPKLEESPYTLTSVDLGSWKLPLFNEQVIPAQLPADDPTSGYAHELSKAWSKEIRSHDAVVFVTPQYNGGYPASLKNAIDYLYHEWVGKPAMVISYGGRGGSKATEQLLPILGAVKMKVTKVSPALALGRSMGSAMREGALVEGQAEDWLKAGVGEQTLIASLLYAVYPMYRDVLAEQTKTSTMEEELGCRTFGTDIVSFDQESDKAKVVDSPFTLDLIHPISITSLVAAASVLLLALLYQRPPSKPAFQIKPMSQTLYAPTNGSGKSIALIIGSTRTPRVGPTICTYVHSVLAPKLVGCPYTLQLVDLAEWNLPLFNETIMPAQLPANDPTPGYTHDLSKAWSREIRKYDAIIFVTPQYNWGIPAALKNAIDFLYHEWANKPAIVITYGGRGGDKVRDQLVQVLTGVHMNVVSVRPGLALGRNVAASVTDGKLVDGQEEQWTKAGIAGQIIAAWDEMVAMLEKPKEEGKEAK